ncbi:hypothetical protein [Acidaminococcus massiliensis]|uniref:hypothetical protein n=1 Tax=Acidaminococcus massiliensis TaxID=1852375 RepID=UPI00248DD8A6|nr:hypothetical protein [Acidaminococcus massiliensis]
MATSNKNLLRMIKEYCARTQCDCCIFDDEGQCELMEVPRHWNVEGITRDIESELEKEPLFKKCDACDFLDDGLCKFSCNDPEDWPDPDYVRQVIESDLENRRQRNE